MLLKVPRHRVDHFYQAVIKPIKAELDSTYMEHATLASDLRIILQTFTSCLNCTAAPCEEVATLVEDYAYRQETHEGAVLHAALLAMQYAGDDFVTKMADLDCAGDLNDAA